MKIEDGLVIATRNKKKKEEIVSILSDLKLRLYTLDEFENVPEVVEDKNTLEGNAIKKAIEVALNIKKITLADDSGLEVDALDNRPGVHSARFAGQDQNDQANIDKLLKLLEGVPADQRKARFRCVIALADPEGLIDVVEGRCEGLIAFERKGEYGFGYDPVFIVPEYNRTFAELGQEIKDKISHRALALQAAREIILKVF